LKTGNSRRSSKSKIKRVHSVHISQNFGKLDRSIQQVLAASAMSGEASFVLEG